MRILVSLAGWAVVVTVALLITFNMDDGDNQVLWFLPILGAAIVAAILTQAAFTQPNRSDVPDRDAARELTDERRPRTS